MGVGLGSPQHPLSGEPRPPSKEYPHLLDTPVLPRCARSSLSSCRPSSSLRTTPLPQTQAGPPQVAHSGLVPVSPPGPGLCSESRTWALGLSQLLEWTWQ